MPYSIFSLWVEGYACTGEMSDAEYLGEIQGTDFSHAVTNYVEALPKDLKRFWTLSPTGEWRRWGCKAFDNEACARRSFG